MNIKEVLVSTVFFFEKHKIAQPRLDAEVLLAHLLQMERIQLYVNYDLPLKEDELVKYRELVKKRARRVPVAYLIGGREFMSLDFHVNSDVLIPRPETELLVEEIIKYCDDIGIDKPNIVDLGTGSGVIAVSLGYYLKEARVLGIDISSKALKIARKNIEKYQLSERIKVLEGDLLQPLISMNKNNVDIIVSNPPYISSGDLGHLAPEVRVEPQLALDGGADGLNYYRKIIEQAPLILKKDGLLAIEIGYNQFPAIKNIFDDKWSEIRVIKDYSGHDRVVMSLKR